MPSETLIAQLEDAVQNGSPERRTEMLRRVTDLFLGECHLVTEQQIRVFDDVLTHLTDRIETKALVQLSTALGPIANAPTEVMRQLSRHDEIAVAGPVLRQSSRLSEQDLIEIARSKSQDHLRAMSQRPSLQPSVTDALIERGDRDVHRTLASNTGAQFSEVGYASLVKKSYGDEVLTESLGLRLDIPLPLLTQLLTRATDKVRARLLAAVNPDNQEKIQKALASITRDFVRHGAGPRDFAAAESLVDQLNRQGRLNEAVLTDFVKQGKYEEMAATLALFCGVNCEVVKRLLKNVDHDGVVITCRAARLNWTTTRLVLESRFAHHMLSQQELDAANRAFNDLSEVVAQRSMRFMQMQEKVKQKTA